ncbi:PhzF family phenazine biosynthesis protein [Streptomyces sp. CMB-StM0423]|uniref:PhzF family phenazine biosynthesis protein n=1 Tax=Streptomyces sp. CMB-StM0423 TaxID=2059884 RepID=UPI000C6FF195|nr:PhzF family phenazine biosynthesis isomerase [Streptomyces sp. CMB-StM0423]AUH39626.1 phenazine biosynthesis protein [Streptomyces sp. CMB-StM0423]
MKMEIAWWDLKGSPATVESLRRHLNEDGVVHNWQAVEGLREKFWIADPDGQRWGAVMVWDGEQPASLPENLAASLVGSPITHRDRFEVQATARGAGAVRTPDSAHRYVVVDAFATRPLSGNPVAVFFDAADLTDEQMQRITEAMNLSEAVFLLPPKAADAEVRVRIFTPGDEIPFAGHPLLAAAAAVALDLGTDRLRFETQTGVVPFTVDRTPAAQSGGGVAYVSMEQPIPVWEPYEHAEALLTALGITASTLPVDVYRSGPRHVFVGLPDAAALAGLRPGHPALAAFPGMAATCFAPEGERWHARMFSPADGAAEDAAPGSAAGALAVHLARYGLVTYGKTVEIHQGSRLGGRHSVMFAEATVAGSGEIDRVRVSGHATVAAEGTIHV